MAFSGQRDGLGPAPRHGSSVTLVFASSFKGERKSIGVGSRVIPFRHCLKPRTQSRPVYSGQRGGLRPALRHGSSVTLVFASSFKGERKSIGARSRAIPFRHCLKPRTQSRPVYSGQRGGLRPVLRHGSSVTLVFASSFKGERKSIGVGSRVIPFRHCLKPRTQSRPVYSGQRDGLRPAPRHKSSLLLSFKKEGQAKKGKRKGRSCWTALSSCSFLFYSNVITCRGQASTHCPQAVHF